MEIPVSLLAAFPPSRERLLDCVRRLIDDRMLMVIARADYGQGADEAFRALQLIRDTGHIPPTLPFIVSEVLELTRFSVPDRPNRPPFEPGPTGPSGHRIRLFACAVLLRRCSEPDFEWWDLSHDSTLAKCLDSANILGDELLRALASELTGHFAILGPPHNPLLEALALLMIATRLRGDTLTEEALGEIADWILRLDAAKVEHGLPFDYHHPLPALFSLQSDFWRGPATEFATGIAAIGSLALREKLQLCALLVDG